jgi:riboflavin synthase
MFTGIVAAVGRIIASVPFSAASTVDVTDTAAGMRLRIDAGGLDLNDVALGDSIAIQGACMTVVALAPAEFSVDISRESLNRTAGLEQLGEVNLEKAMRLSDRIGGHLVSGHVDGIGSVRRFQAVGESWLLVVHAQQQLARFLAYKGSITVNGVSLTVNEVHDDRDGCEFSINLIPHTIAVTTLRHLKVGDRVNLEVDLIARYVERMLNTDRQ